MFVRYILFSFIIFFNLSCTTTIDSLIPSGVFDAPYPVVWQSSMMALKKYPFKMVDQENGTMETKIIRGYHLWEPPPGSIKNVRNRHYVIKLLFSKGTLKDNSATKVQVIKDEFVNKDFIQQSIPVQSNGIEEEIILYRIGRAIQLAKARKNFFENKDIDEEELE